MDLARLAILECLVRWVAWLICLMHCSHSPLCGLSVAHTHQHSYIERIICIHSNYLSDESKSAYMILVWFDEIVDYFKSYWYTLDQGIHQIKLSNLSVMSGEQNFDLFLQVHLQRICFTYSKKLFSCHLPFKNWPLKIIKNKLLTFPIVEHLKHISNLSHSIDTLILPLHINGWSWVLPSLLETPYSDPYSDLLSLIHRPLGLLASAQDLPPCVKSSHSQN